MATTRKESSVLSVELLDDAGAAAITWRINNPATGLSRSDVYDVVKYAFKDNDDGGNRSGYNLLRNATGFAANSLGQVLTIDSVTVTTTTELV